MVWLKKLKSKLHFWYLNMKENRKYKKRIKELKKEDPFIYK
tara:strand:- start:288 stop:410 length:123 start_codon:yes stop_codon:yes gene_type:complete